MFFDLVLLNRQHGSGFGFAWIGATRGVKHINKNEIIKIDIGKLCGEIAKFMCSESDAPRSRFSLRLSTILVNGTIRIQRQKAEYLLDEIIAILTKVSAPPEIERPQIQPYDPTVFLTPPAPIPRVKGKKRRPVQPAPETPESELARLTQQINKIYETTKEAEVAPSRVDDITLREEQPLAQGEFDTGELGVLTDEQLRQLGVEPLPRVSAVPPPPAMTVEGEVRVPRSPEAPEVEEPAIGVVPEEVVPPVVPPVVPEPREEPQVAVEEPPPRRILGEIQFEDLEERAKTPPAAVRRLPKKPINKMAIDFRPVKNVRIDRCKPGDSELVSIEPPCPLPRFRLVNPNLTSLLNMYTIRGLPEDLHRKGPSREPSLRESESLRRKSGRITPVEVTRDEEAPMRTIPTGEEVMHTLPVATPTPLVSSTPVPEVAEAEIFSPKKRRRILHVESEASPEIEELSLVPVSVPVLTEKGRRQEIINKLLRSEVARLTLEEVCPPPINKRNIAITFNDLLVLCKHRYTTLISEDDSSELKYVEKGSRML